jgi:hypothetical protein
VQITPTSAPASVLQNQQPQSQAHSTGPETTSTNVSGILADAGDNSSHIVGPVNVDDSDILESYLSTTPAAGGTRLIRSYSTSDASDRSTRPVLFRTVPKRSAGVASYQCRASEKCALIEKFIEPHADILLDLYVHFIICLTAYEPECLLFADSSNGRTAASLFWMKARFEMRT